MSRLDGIDVSHWQELNGQPFPPLTFAITKLTEGVRYVDPEATTHLDAFRKADQIKVTGAYLFLNSGRPGRDQANHFIDEATKRQFASNEIVVVDWERDSAGLFASVDAVREALTVLDTKYGAHRVFMYSAPWVTGFASWRGSDPNRPLIVANYGSSGHIVAQQWNATVLQYTNKAVVSGFSAPIDGNEVLQSSVFLALDAPRPPVVKPPTKPLWSPWNPTRGSFGAWPWKAKPTIYPGATHKAVAYATTVIAFRAGGNIKRTETLDLQAKARVKDLQALFGLKQDGIIGPQTWGAIDLLAKGAK